MFTDILKNIIFDASLLFSILMMKIFYYINLVYYKNIADILVDLSKKFDSNEKIFELGVTMSIIAISEFSYRVFSYIVSKKVNNVITNYYENIYKKLIKKNEDLEKNLTIIDIDTRKKLLTLPDTISTTEALASQILVEIPTTIVYVFYFTWNIIFVNQKLLIFMFIGSIAISLLTRKFYNQKTLNHNEKINSERDIKNKFTILIDLMSSNTDKENIKDRTIDEYKKRYQSKIKYCMNDNIIFLIRDTIPLIIRFLLIVFSINKISTNEMKVSDLIFASTHTSFTIKYIVDLYSTYDDFRRNKKTLDEVLDLV